MMSYLFLVSVRRDMCRLASDYGALVFLDECHATGILGATGR